MEEVISFESFKQEWLAEITEGHPTTVELGNRFSRKLITQWLGINSDDDGLIYCDGCNDGGIDLAYLQREDAESNDTSETPSERHTWYLVQSKYGSAFQGPDTLLAEANKIIETLSGHRAKLSSLAEGLVERLRTFLKQASENDRLYLIFATTEPLNEAEARVLERIRRMGRDELGIQFDAKSISINTIYENTVETFGIDERIRVNLKASVNDTGIGLLVGTVNLIDLYLFLKEYQKSNHGDLDMIYERNVRRFLGGRGRVNAAIAKTLETCPEKFGLYNNGITIVAMDFAENDGYFLLTEPFIVNGCQTTRTIWDVLQRRLEAGGTGQNPALQAWRKQLEQGVVVIKIVRLDAADAGSLTNITRFTNSQNAVREKDFINLIEDFNIWHNQMATQYNIYLEIQRGGWDSQRALQKQQRASRSYDKYANAFDLFKVYGAGWLGEAGIAFSKNTPFLPGGSIYQRIVDIDGNPDHHFGVKDLYAAYLLQVAADEQRFGRVAEKITRRQTRFLFYMVAVDILRDVLLRTDGKTGNYNEISEAIIALADPEHAVARQGWLESAIEVIDSYLTEGTEDTVFLELEFKQRFNYDLNAYLKWDRLGKSELETPRLRSSLMIAKKMIGRAQAAGQPTTRDLMIGAIKSKE